MKMHQEKFNKSNTNGRVFLVNEAEYDRRTDDMLKLYGYFRQLAHSARQFARVHGANKLLHACDTYEPLAQEIFRGWDLTGGYIVFGDKSELEKQKAQLPTLEDYCEGFADEKATKESFYDMADRLITLCDTAEEIRYATAAFLKKADGLLDEFGNIDFEVFEDYGDDKYSAEDDE